MRESPELRSRIMRAVKGRNTSPELLVRSLVHRQGYRFRLHRKNLPGSPDLVFAGRRKVIFVHGCFWHGHHCKRGARVPKSNMAYWKAKIARNVARDAGSLRQLKKAGWRALIVWECELKNEAKLKNRIDRFFSKEA